MSIRVRKSVLGNIINGGLIIEGYKKTRNVSEVKYVNKLHRKLCYNVPYDR